jgi:hypothetical protein
VPIRIRAIEFLGGLGVLLEGRGKLVLVYEFGIILNLLSRVIYSLRVADDTPDGELEAIIV